MLQCPLLRRLTGSLTHSNDASGFSASLSPTLLLFIISSFLCNFGRIENISAKERLDTALLIALVGLVSTCRRFLFADAKIEVDIHVDIYRVEVVVLFASL